MSTFSYQPIIVIGAPRSGTNMLRDALVSFPGVSTWPCDELPFVWRFNNAAFPHDEFPSSFATEKVCAYINRTFDQCARRTGARFVVEKTCANSLRTEFVARALSRARFVFIVRHGLDAAASAMKRWVAPVDLQYLAHKVRYVPVCDAPRYLLNFVANRVKQRCSREHRMATWGPRFNGMALMAETATLAQICAHQWQRCVERSLAGLKLLPPERIIRLRYESLVNNGPDELGRVVEWAGISANRELLDHVSSSFRRSSVGRARGELSATEREAMLEIIGPTLEQLGYQKGFA